MGVNKVSSRIMTDELPDFETALRELEGIVRKMETAELPLEESLIAYERGMRLLKSCQGALSVAENRLSTFEAGREMDQDNP